MVIVVLLSCACGQMMSTSMFVCAPLCVQVFFIELICDDDELIEENIKVRMYVYTYMWCQEWMHQHVCVCVCACVRVCVRACVRAPVAVFGYMCTYAYICMCVCVCMLFLCVRFAALQCVQGHTVLYRNNI